MYFLFLLLMSSTVAFSADTSLQNVGGKFEQPTDIAFLPDAPQTMLVLEKTGKLKWFDLRLKKGGTVLSIKVPTKIELGLLGIAFHPDFKKNRKFYLNYNVSKEGKYFTVISEWRLDPALKATSTGPLLEVFQPYANHNGGQLAFGPDGYLYVGFGDGGWANDPHGHGQNRKTFLGTIIRIDVNKTSPNKRYSIPSDNPFLNDKDALPEIWAWGFRNPWRFSFGPKGQLIVADVGQNTWEEVSLVTRGNNYGWNIKEGKHCFRPKEECSSKGLVDPILEYGRDQGGSITGGYVTEEGKYIFGDFLSGRVWAASLQPPYEKSELGQWPIQISTFGRDAAGRIYVADFSDGLVYLIATNKKSE